MNTPIVLTESQFDKYLSDGRFFRGYGRDDAPADFATRLEELIEELSGRVEGEFGDLVYVDHDLAPADRIRCEVDSKTDVMKALALCFVFLRDHAPEYCILVTFYENILDGETYIGRLALRLDAAYCEEAVFGRFGEKWT